MVERYRPINSPRTSLKHVLVTTAPPRIWRLVLPTDIDTYFDKLQFWRRIPLDRKNREWLSGQCRALYTDSRKPARFDFRFRQRVDVTGITYAGLEWLAHQEGIWINRIEVSIDYTFEDRRDRDETLEYFHRHLVRRHHGRDQEIRCYRDKDGAPWREHEIRSVQTRYDSGPYSPHSIVLYKEGVSRLSGEIAPLLHLEWRARGARALRSLGINSAIDLLSFDHRAFWSGRLLLKTISTNRLGRRYCNWRDQTKSRVGTSEHERFGESILRSVDTIQELLDKHGKAYSIRRALDTVPNDFWLPDPSSTPL